MRLLPSPRGPRLSTSTPGRLKESSPRSGSPSCASRCSTPRQAPVKVCHSTSDFSPAVQITCNPSSLTSEQLIDVAVCICAVVGLAAASPAQPLGTRNCCRQPPETAKLCPGTWSCLCKQICCSPGHPQKSQFERLLLHGCSSMGLAASCSSLSTRHSHCRGLLETLKSCPCHSCPAVAAHLAACRDDDVSDRSSVGLAASCSAQLSWHETLALQGAARDQVWKVPDAQMPPRRAHPQLGPGRDSQRGDCSSFAGLSSTQESQKGGGAGNEVSNTAGVGTTCAAMLRQLPCCSLVSVQAAGSLMQHSVAY